MKGLYAAVGIVALPLVLNCCSGDKKEYRDIEFKDSGRPIAAVANGRWLSVLYDPTSKLEGPVVRSFDYRVPQNAGEECAILQGEIAYGDSAGIEIRGALGDHGFELKDIDIKAKHFPFCLGEHTPEKDW